MVVCVWVCVRERQRQRERIRHTETGGEGETRVSRKREGSRFTGAVQLVLVTVVQMVGSDGQWFNGSPVQ